MRSSAVTAASFRGTTGISPDLVRNADGTFKEKVRHFNWRVIFRFRTMLYFGIWALVGIGMLIALGSRDRLELNVLHDRNPLHVTLSDGSIRNGYTVKLLNMIPEPRTIFLSLEGLPGATMSVTGIDQPDGTSFAIPVDPDRVRSIKVYVRQPPDHVEPGRTAFRLIAEDKGSNESDVYNATFDAPEEK